MVALDWEMGFEERDNSGFVVVGVLGGFGFKEDEMVRCEY